MSDESKTCLTAVKLQKELSLLGFSSFFYRSQTDDDFSKKLRLSILTNPEMASDLISYFLDQDEESLYKDGHYKKDILNSIFRNISEFEIDAYSNPFWKSKIDAMLDEGLSTRQVVQMSIRDRATYLLDAASLIPDYNWKTMFDSFYENYHNGYNSWMSSSFVDVIQKYSKANTDSFKEFVEDSIFFSKKKPNYQARKVFYRCYVAEGLLTKKTARKIRSDGAEEASLAGVTALINSDLYKDKTEMLLQFTDSRYPGVLQELAKELPIHLLASIMGSNDYWVKRIIEDRLMAQEDGSNV